MTKNWKKITAEKKNQIFFESKTTIYLSLGLHKERPSYRRSLQLSKEAIQHLKTWTFKITFVGHFCPPGSGSEFRIRIRIRIHWPVESGSNPDPDPQPWNRKNKSLDEKVHLPCWPFHFRAAGQNYGKGRAFFGILDPPPPRLILNEASNEWLCSLPGCHEVFDHSHTKLVRYNLLEVLSYLT